MESAEGQVQNLQYTAAFPLLMNISNEPTYFMALKDGAGLVKKYAMVNIQKYQNVAIGDTVAECEKAYVKLLAANGISSGENNSVSETVTGTIQRMAQAVIDGNSHFYVVLENEISKAREEWQADIANALGTVENGLAEVVSLPENTEVTE